MCFTFIARYKGTFLSNHRFYCNMLNGVFLLSDAGEVLLQKDFLFTASQWRPEKFSSVLKQKGKTLPVCILYDGIYYVHILRENIYLVALTDESELSPFIIVEYLEKLSEILKDFLGSLNPKCILSSIGLVYEIICESTDAGFPKVIDTAKLKPFLCNNVTRPKSTDLLDLLPSNLFGLSGDEEKRETSSESSRKPLHNVRSKVIKEEVYVDLIETLSVIIDSSGSLVMCNISGKLNIKSYLGDAAKVGITFSRGANDLSKVIFNSSIAKQDLPLIKTVVTPGNLHVLSYNTTRLGEELSLPFTLYSSIISYPRDKMLTLNLKIHCSLPVRHPAVNLIGKIQLPVSTANASGVSSLANVTFQQDKKNNEYHFKSPLFPGNSQHTVNLKLVFSSWTEAIVFELASVVLQFEVPMMCHSDTKISGLKIERISCSNEPVNKWVRYLTYANSYEFYLKDDWF